MLAWLIAISALILEITSLQFLGLENRTTATFCWLGLHLLSCFLLLIVSSSLLPGKFHNRSIQDRLFFFFVPLLIPLAGMTGALMAVIPALYHPRKKQTQYFIDARHPGLPYQSSEVQCHQHMRFGSLRRTCTLKTLIRSSDAMDERVKAVLATRSLQDPKATQILREALKDSADDVRLLAYSVLDQKETEIRHALQKAAQEVASTNPAPLLAVKHLACLHRDLVRMDLVQGSGAEALEQKAVAYANLVLEHDRDIDMLLLKGNIFLEQHKLEEATTCFLQAVDAGLERSSIETRLFEIAYLSRDFAKTTAIAKNLVQLKYYPTTQAKAINHWSQPSLSKLATRSSPALTT